jgi:DNA repair photolyase
MNVIYEPKGRAREYSELACNLYKGCTHGCKYCFAPACMRTSNDVWHSRAMVRQNVIESFEKDAVKIKKDGRRILFSFLSDPYQPLEKSERITRQALTIAEKYQLKTQILTKGCNELIQDDFELMKRIGSHLGITLCFTDDTARKIWEPHAAPIEDRLKTLKSACHEGIFTWVSLEPVIDPNQALSVIREAHPFVKFWKVGKINHNKIAEKSVNWHEFYQNVTELLNKLKANYYIKADLQKYSVAPI